MLFSTVTKTVWWSTVKFFSLLHQNSALPLVFRHASPKRNAFVKLRVDHLRKITYDTLTVDWVWRTIHIISCEFLYA